MSEPKPDEHVKFTFPKAYCETSANIKGVGRYLDAVTSRLIRPSEIRAKWLMDPVTQEYRLSWVRIHGPALKRSTGEQQPGRHVFAWKAERLSEAPDWVRRYVEEAAHLPKARSVATPQDPSAQSERSDPEGEQR